MMSEEKPYGDWTVFDSTDDFTDEYTIRATASAATATSSADDFSIVVECFRSKSDVPDMLFCGAELRPLHMGNIKVDLRVDTEEVASGISGRLVTDSNDDRAVLIDGGKVAELIKQMSESEEGKKKMILRITYEEVVTILRYKVSLKGFEEAYEHLLRDCRK